MFAAVLFAGAHAGASVLGGSESGSGGIDDTGASDESPPSPSPPAPPSPPFEKCVKDDDGQCDFLVAISWSY